MCIVGVSKCFEIFVTSTHWVLNLSEIRNSHTVYTSEYTCILKQGSAVVCLFPQSRNDWRRLTFKLLSTLYPSEECVSRPKSLLENPHFYMNDTPPTPAPPTSISCSHIISHYCNLKYYGTWKQPHGTCDRVMDSGCISVCHPVISLALVWEWGWRMMMMRFLFRGIQSRGEWEIGV